MWENENLKSHIISTVWQVMCMKCKSIRDYFLCFLETKVGKGMMWWVNTKYISSNKPSHISFVQSTVFLFILWYECNVCADANFVSLQRASSSCTARRGCACPPTNRPSSWAGATPQTPPSTGSGRAAPGWSTPGPPAACGLTPAPACHATPALSPSAIALTRLRGSATARRGNLDWRRLRCTWRNRGSGWWSELTRDIQAGSNMTHVQGIRGVTSWRPYVQIQVSGKVKGWCWRRGVECQCEITCETETQRKCNLEFKDIYHHFESFYQTLLTSCHRNILPTPQKSKTWTHLTRGNSIPSTS